MGYGYIAHFIDTKNKRVLGSSFADYLKTINLGSYNINFNNVESSIDNSLYKDLLKLIEKPTTAFVGYIKKEDLKEHWDLKKSKYSKTSLYITEENYDKIKDELPFVKNYNIEDSQTYYCLYKVGRNFEIEGKWFTLNDFIEGLNTYKKSLEQCETEKTKLLNIKESIEFYNLKSEGRELLLNNLEDIEQQILEYKSCIDSINTIITLFYYYREDWFDSDPNSIIKESNVYFEDNRNVLLFIEII